MIQSSCIFTNALWYLLLKNSIWSAQEGAGGGRNVLSGSQSQHPRAENKRLGLGPRASALMLSARRWRKGIKPLSGQPLPDGSGAPSLSAPGFHL